MTPLKTVVSLLGSPDLWTLVPAGHGWSHPREAGGVRPLEITASVTLKGIFMSDSLPPWETCVQFGTFIFLLLQPLWTACTQGGPVLLAGGSEPLLCWAVLFPKALWVIIYKTASREK